MADTTYSMNQFRYNGGAECLNSVNIKPLYLDWQIDTSNSPYYRDILLQTEDGSSFEANTSYCLTFGIPRNLNYDLNFSIKLLKDYEGYLYDSAKTAFQFVRYISAKRTTTDGTRNSLVCLYQINGEDAGRSAIRYDTGNTQNDVNYIFPVQPDEVSPAGVGTQRFFYEIQDPVGISGETGPASYTYYPNILYHNKNIDTYWMFRGEPKIATRDEGGNIVDPFGENNILVGTNDMILNWSWMQSSTSNMAYYKLIFTPSSTAVIFNYILIQLERIAEDADIISGAIVEDKDEYKPAVPNNGVHPGRNQSIYGRFVDLDQATGNEDEVVADTFKLYKLVNLNASILNTNGATITRFGLWGHPELMMAVNGEEIQVGSSGYYELNDFEVKSLSVVASGIEDSFTLDYQYVV